MNTPNKAVSNRPTEANREGPLRIFLHDFCKNAVFFGVLLNRTVMTSRAGLTDNRAQSWKCAFFETLAFARHLSSL
jgi:hypothetical protein